MNCLKKTWIAAFALLTFVGCQSAHNRYSASKLENEQLRTQIGSAQGMAALDTPPGAAARSTLIPGQTTPSREEELWVVAKYQGNEQPAAPADDQRSEERRR